MVIKVFIYFQIKVQNKGHLRIKVCRKLHIANDGTN
jgi:hypothetical protein